MKNFIRKFRKNKGLSQETLAECCGATKATISKLEKGEIQLTQAWMDKISKVLDCQPWELMAEGVHINTITKSPERMGAGELITHFQGAYAELESVERRMVIAAILAFLQEESKKNTSSDVPDSHKSHKGKN